MTFIAALLKQLKLSIDYCLYFIITCHTFLLLFSCYVNKSKPASVAQLHARPTGDQEVAGSTPPGRQHSFVETDHEIFSTVILYLPLFKKRICQFLAKEWAQYWLAASRTKPGQ